MTKHEELATISGVAFGMRDAGYVNLSFSVKTLHYGALQVLGIDETVELIKKHHIHNIKNLEGAPCIVEIEGMSIIFKDLKK